MRSLWLGAALWLLPTGGSAQSGVAIDQYDPVPVGDRGFAVQSPDARGDQQLRLGLGLDYVHDPLVLHLTDEDEDAGAVISDQLWLRVQASVALADRFMLSLMLPAAVVQSGDDPSDAGSGLSATSPDSFELGDLRLGARARLLGAAREGLQLALGAHLWLPTGASDSLVSDGHVRGMPMLIFGGLHDRLNWSTQAGVMIRKGQQLPGDAATPVGTALSFGAGIGYLVDTDRNLRLGADLYGQTVVAKGGEAFTEDSTNSELLAGGHYRVGGGPIVISLGAGPGLGRGAGTPAFRVVAGVAFDPEEREQPPADRDGDGIPDAQDACPDAPGVATGVPTTHGCPPDRDGDGIPDAQDACPDTPGVASEDPQKHGCPADRDGDGIPDAQDACPDEPGEASQDPAAHGCPPPVDQDGDGIGDDRDACPTVPGVRSDDPQKHGCPPDRDGDGVLDEQDACPDEPGVQQPDPKQNGCPIAKLEKEEKRITISQQIQFDTAKATIRPESNPVLQDLLNVMTKHPELARIEVQGHTDSRGSRRLNTKLSFERAKAVVAWLVEHGVAKERLTAKGFGPDRPIGDNATEAGRQQNRRVEFLILAGPGEETKP